MPTKALMSRGDLEAERDRFVRISEAQKRLDLLEEIHKHLDKLDVEIVRLGGTARGSQRTEEVRRSRIDSDEPPKKRGWPETSQVLVSEENDAPNSVSNTNLSQAAEDKTGSKLWSCDCGEHMASGKRRCGQCRRWRGGKRRKRWNNKLLSPHGPVIRLRVKRTSPGAAKIDAIEKKTTEARVAKAEGAEKKTTKAIDVYRVFPPAHFQSTMDGGDRDTPRSEVDAVVVVMVACVAATGQVEARDMPYTCECGEQMVVGKMRCGKCHRWRGGKRGPRQGQTVSATSGGGSTAGRRRSPRKRTQRDSIWRVASSPLAVSCGDSDSHPTAEAPRKRVRPTEKRQE